MYKIRLVLSFVCLLLVQLLVAQTSFSVSTEYVEVSKPANYAFFYDYVQLENNTEDTLWMRWEKNGRSNSPALIPEGWETSIQDPNNFYLPAGEITEADFFLPPEAGTTDKVILQVYPNNIPASYQLDLKLYPLDNPLDSVIITFDYEATPLTSSYESFTPEELRFQFIPANNMVQVGNQSPNTCIVQAFNANGMKIESWQIPPACERFRKLPAWAPGVYYFVISDGHRRLTKPVCVSR